MRRRAFRAAGGIEDRFGIAVMNNLLGGGMSSRLFQNIREKRGLAYAVFQRTDAVLRRWNDDGVRRLGERNCGRSVWT